jgi:hypothetical protein
MSEQKEEIVNKEKDFVIQLNGGIGKCICATSMIKWVNDKYPDRKITVISPWPELFEYNPRVWRNLPMNQAYLYEDYIKGKDYRIGDPYNLIEYYREEKKEHICELYPKAYGFEEKDKYFETEFYTTVGEENDSINFKNSGPPVFTIQFHGGIPQGQPVPQHKSDGTQRDMQVQLGTAITNKLRQKGFRVLQVAQQNEPAIPGALRMNLPFRRYICMIPQIVGHIGIDSSMMHGVATYKVPQLIFFGQTHKDNLGYKYDGFFAKHKKNAMYCRPHVGVPDNGGIYPYRDPAERTAMNWSLSELDKAVDEFIEYCGPRVQKLYPNLRMNIPLQKNKQEVKQNEKKLLPK